MKRWTSGVSTLLILAVASLSAAEDRFNVDFTIGWGGCYRPMEWTPVEIGIGSTLAKPFGGMVTVTAKVDDLTNMTVGHQFVLTPDVHLNLPMVTKLDFGGDKCTLKIINSRGRICWDYDYELWDFSVSNRLLTAVRQEDLLIGLVGRRGFGLPLLGKNTSSETQESSGSVYVKDKLPRSVPWDWTGFASLDVLVLYDPDWESLNTHQSKAIAQWVTNGGKLLVVLGTNPLPSRHAIAELLPFEIGPPKQKQLSPDILSAWGSDSPQETTLTYHPIKPKASARFWDTKTFVQKGPPPPRPGRRRRGISSVVSSEVAKKFDPVPYTPNDPLFVTAFVGFGRVGVLGFDPAGLTPQPKVDTARFWAQHLNVLLGDSDTPGYRTIIPSEKHLNQPSYFQHYEFRIANQGLNSVFEYLLNIPELRPLSIWWVILLLSLLALLLGPVDYLVLKRLDRLPLTWITSAICIVLFTVGAYFGVNALRSGVTQVRTVSVLDGIEGTDTAWSTIYMGLFAPDSDEYRLENLKLNQWWSGIAPTMDNVYAFNRNKGTRSIFCVQHDGGNLPSSLPINIWSMQCLMSESPQQRMPISATVKRFDEELVVTVTNRSNYPIRNGYVRLDENKVMRFGGVPAEGTEQFRGRLHARPEWDEFLGERDRGYSMMSQSAKFTNDAAYFARGCLKRTRTIEAYLRKGAAVVCVKYDQAPVSFSVADRKCDNSHIKLVRLVVFPQKEQTE